MTLSKDFELTLKTQEDAKAIIQALIQTFESKDHKQKIDLIFMLSHPATIPFLREQGCGDELDGIMESMQGFYKRIFDRSRSGINSMHQMEGLQHLRNRSIMPYDVSGFAKH